MNRATARQPMLPLNPSVGQRLNGPTNNAGPVLSPIA